MYVKANGSEIQTFPYSLKQMKLDNSNVSFPKIISDELAASYNVFPVVEDPVPEHSDATQYIELNSAPTLVDGVWKLGWTVVTRNSDQQSAYDEDVGRILRVERDTKLAATDWWALPDSPTMTSEQTAYRQALRDLPTHSNWPHLSESDWPTKP